MAGSRLLTKILTDFPQRAILKTDERNFDKKK